jgi:hypothetical protein
MSKFSYYIFGNPTTKTVTGIAYTGKLLIANYLDQPFDRPIRNTEPQSGPIYYTLLEVHNCVVPFTSHASCTNLVQKNQFPELNGHILTFSQ